MDSLPHADFTLNTVAGRGYNTDAGTGRPLFQVHRLVQEAKLRKNCPVEDAQLHTVKRRLD